MPSECQQCETARDKYARDMIDAVRSELRDIRKEITRLWNNGLQHLSARVSALEGAETHKVRAAQDWERVRSSNNPIATFFKSVPPWGWVLIMIIRGPEAFEFIKHLIK